MHAHALPLCYWTIIHRLILRETGSLFQSELFLTHIIHERFCSNRGFTATTSQSAGVLASQSLDVLFQVRLGPSRLCLPVSLGD
jgi:hypothetical protein